ncbi:MAG: hypothetical protein F6J93_17620 [Oscillatoria sp. SIO1A7]|nr:hypothetical protein [Oscillatoria sp. SIO1A7]
MQYIRIINYSSHQTERLRFPGFLGVETDTEADPETRFLKQYLCQNHSLNLVGWVEVRWRSQLEE